MQPFINIFYYHEIPIEIIYFMTWKTNFAFSKLLRTLKIICIA